MSKILKKWVGADELAKIACLNVATPWYDCECHTILVHAVGQVLNISLQ